MLFTYIFEILIKVAFFKPPLEEVWGRFYPKI